ncbi:MAG: killer suppression protein [Candidatus Sumerlaeia bacterium]|nr:killer suppression protein [Candidatus Sumerlaeia bacterium]
MEVHFESETLRKVFEKEKKLRAKHGAKRAGLIQLRLAQIMAATCLEDLRNLPGPRIHQHVRSQGQEKAVFSVDLDHPYRLLFEAFHDPEPTLPGGGVDWSKVTKILIKGVEDPHG